MTKIAIAPDVVAQEIDGEMVLLNFNNEGYYGLDDVGTHIWQLLAETGDTEVVVARMLAEYWVDETTIRQDVDKLIQDLLDEGLILPASGLP